MTMTLKFAYLVLMALVSTMVEGSFRGIKHEQEELLNINKDLGRRQLMMMEDGGNGGGNGGIPDECPKMSKDVPGVSILFKLLCLSWIQPQFLNLSHCLSTDVRLFSKPLSFQHPKNRNGKEDIHDVIEILNVPNCVQVLRVVAACIIYKAVTAVFPNGVTILCFVPVSQLLRLTPSRSIKLPMVMKSFKPTM